MAMRGRALAGAGLQGVGGRHTEKPPKGLVLDRAPTPISCPAESPGAPRSHQCVRKSSSSISPASRDERRGAPCPPLQCHSSRHRCPPGWLGTESGAGLALPLRTGSREAERSTKALGLCTAECGSLLPGRLAGNGGGSVPRGTGHIQPCPSPGSQPTQPPLLVQLLEEGLAEFVGADHDGAGGCHLNDTGQEACKDSPVSPSVTPQHPCTPARGGGTRPYLQTAPGCQTRHGCVA